MRKEDVIKIIKGSFSITAQQKCTNFVYGKSKGFIILKATGGKSVIISTRVNKVYDMSRGLS